MKNSISILLALIFLAYQAIPIVVFVEFKINQDFISAFLCINKDKPEKKCNGQCHLKQEVEKATSQQEDKEPVTIRIRKIIQIVYTQNQFHNESLRVVKTKKISSHNIEIPSICFIDGVFHPPKYILI